MKFYGKRMEEEEKMVLVNSEWINFYTANESFSFPSNPSHRCIFSEKAKIRLVRCVR